MITVTATDRDTGELIGQGTVADSEHASIAAATWSEQGHAVTMVEEHEPGEPVQDDTGRCIGRMMPGSDTPQTPVNLAMRLTMERVNRERMLEMASEFQDLANQHYRTHKHLVSGGDL